MQTFSDKIRREYYKLNFQNINDFVSKHDISFIKKIEENLPYNEDSLCLIGESNAEGEIHALKCDFATCTYLIQKNAGMRRPTAAVTLQCPEGYVVVERSLAVGNPGILAPVTEIVEINDVLDNLLSFKKIAERGLEEEIGITNTQIFFRYKMATTKNIAGVCHAYTKLSFEEILKKWETAKHKDEGTPKLVNIFENQKILQNIFKKPYTRLPN